MLLTVSESRCSLESQLLCVEDVIVFGLAKSFCARAETCDLRQNSLLPTINLYAKLIYMNLILKYIVPFGHNEVIYLNDWLVAI